MTIDVRTSFTIRGVSGFRYAAALTASGLQIRSIHESFTQSLDKRKSSILKDDVSPSPVAAKKMTKVYFTSTFSQTQSRLHKIALN